MVFRWDKIPNFPKWYCSSSQDAHMCIIWAHYHKICRDSSHNIGRLARMRIQMPLPLTQWLDSTCQMANRPSIQIAWRHLWWSVTIQTSVRYVTNHQRSFTLLGSDRGPQMPRELLCLSEVSTPSDVESMPLPNPIVGFNLPNGKSAFDPNSVKTSLMICNRPNKC